MDSRTQTLPVQFSDGKTFHVQATIISAEEDVASTLLSFDGIAEAITEIATSVVQAIAKAKPHKANVEFGIEAAVESGKLTAVLLKGTGSASLKISLEWGRE